jgi:hypothetical protein
MIDLTRPGVEEQYETAINASDLTVSTYCKGAVDVLIAVGGSASRLGSAMLRLHSEWDSAVKPVKPSQAAIDALALTLPRLKSGGKVDVVGARRIASDWYFSELRELVGRLKALPLVRGEVAWQAEKWGMDDASNKAGAVIKYWLDQNCHACDGLKMRRVLGTPALSHKLCPVCHGSGIGNTPCGQDGRRLANYMDRCVEVARMSIKNRLRSLRK